MSQQTIAGYVSTDGVATPVSAATPLPVSATVALPTGASTSAKQDTGNTSLATIATAVAAATPAGTNHIGQVGSPVDVITITPTLDNANALDAGDTVFDATVITGAIRLSGGSALLESIVVADKDDQKAQLRLCFFDSAVIFGTIDSAPGLSDADSLKCVGTVEVLAADYIDLGGASVATIKGIGLLCKAAGSANLYVAAFTSGTPTYTTGGLQLRLGFLQA